MFKSEVPDKHEAPLRLNLPLNLESGREDSKHRLRITKAHVIVESFSLQSGPWTDRIRSEKTNASQISGWVNQSSVQPMIDPASRCVREKFQYIQ
jgi:hypothetical protein